MTVFKEVNLKVKFPELEEDVLKFWEKEKIFERVQDLRKNSGKNFVFLEGPPTANGLPHPGHVLGAVHQSQPEAGFAVGDAVLCFPWQSGP